MRSITWERTRGNTHRVVIDEGPLVSPLHALGNVGQLGLNQPYPIIT